MLRVKRATSTALKAAVSIVLVLWLFRRIGAASLLQRLLTVDALWLAGAVAAFALSNVLGALQWHLLLRSHKVPIRFAQSLSLYHVGLFFNNFLIGNIGGDALRIYDIRRLSGDGAVAVSSVVFDRFIGFFTLTSLAMLVSLVAVRRLVSLDALYLTAMVLAIWLTALFFLFNARAGALVGRFLRPLLPTAVAGRLRDAYQQIYRLRKSRRALAQLFVISVVVQSLRIITHYWAALSVGAYLGVHYFFIFVPIIALAASLPISFGGIGVREQSAAVIFGAVGLAASQVVAFEFLAYLVGILTALPGGFIFALRKNEIRPKEMVN